MVRRIRWLVAQVVRSLRGSAWSVELGIYVVR